MSPCRSPRVFHYAARGPIRDAGWGCVYRGLQMLVSVLSDSVPTVEQLLHAFGLWQHYARGVRGEALWLEPPDAARYLRRVHGATVAEWLYLPASASAERMRRYTPAHYGAARTLTRWRDLQRVLRHHLCRGPLLLDNGNSAYLMVRATSTRVTLLDPHVFDARHARRRVSWSWVAREPLWMVCALLPPRGVSICRHKNSCPHR